MAKDRHVFVTKKSSGTAQLSQLLKCICKATNGDRVAFVGVDKSGDPVEVNDYCTMYVEKYPCEGSCWTTQDEPPLTEHVTIITPSLVCRVCSGFNCGSFFYLDFIDAPRVLGLPYEDQKGAARDQDMWFKKKAQNRELETAVVRHRMKSKAGMRKSRLKNENKSKDD